MTQAAIARQRRRRRRSDVHREVPGPAKILFVAGEAGDGSVAEHLLVRAAVALRTIGEHVHPRQREARFLCFVDVARLFARAKLQGKPEPQSEDRATPSK
jgi:hypothetical protein